MKNWRVVATDCSRPYTGWMTSFVPIGRLHARRLRDVYRSAGWPSQDAVEVELLAAGLLQRVELAGGATQLRLTDTGLAMLAQAQQRNRQAMSAHSALVQRVARLMQRDGRIAWTNLSLRARLPDPEALADASAAPDQAPVAAHWRICKPDVFSIRNTSVAAYLEPVVHEIKVSRADLLGDLKAKHKRDSYLDVGGQCWYVLGRDTRGRPIAEEHEIPAECGVLLDSAGTLDVARNAPKRPCRDLPFAVWMALAKTSPLAADGVMPQDEPVQLALRPTDQAAS